jgi:hypothetical protein
MSLSVGKGWLCLRATEDSAFQTIGVRNKAAVFSPRWPPLALSPLLFFVDFINRSSRKREFQIKNTNYEEGSSMP